jgi:hypothetical protein
VTYAKLYGATSQKTIALIFTALPSHHFDPEEKTVCAKIAQKL